MSAAALRVLSDRSRAQLLQALGVRISSQRCAAGLSQGMLAGLVGVSESFIDAVERGEVDPGYSMVAEIAQVLGIPSKALLEP